MKTKIFNSIMLFFLSCAILSGQDQPAPTPVPSPAPEGEKKKADFKTLVEQTMPLDIDTASYYELVAWCRLLRIDESGDKAALIQRLKGYFQVKGTKEQKEIIRKIEIKSARSSEYFTLDEMKEDYVLMQGNVVLILTEKKNNTQHTIKAEHILYNQNKAVITASGNVEYTRAKGEKAEVFTGESFVFDVSNWEGVLYFAQGERKQTVEEKDVVFRYRGETVTRLKDDSVLLDQGTITSSDDVDNPNYKITASRIWVFAPGEWAIENAVLYIGNIPVLFIPFYYYTSDDLFFNPVVGIKAKEGGFLQSTIYFIGKKKRKEGVFSFLQLEQTSDEDIHTELRGLFLRPVQTESPSTGTTQTLSSAIKEFKLFADVYSRLGGIVGVSIDAKPAFNLSCGIGVSRSIFNITNIGYTPYYGGIEYWNSGYLFGVKTPFRFGLDMDFTLNAGIIQNITGHFQLYSDPFFGQDFYDREENQDWGKLIGFELTAQTATPVTTTTSTRTNLLWTLNLQINFASLFNSRLFQTLRIDPFNFTFEWGSKDVTNITDPLVAVDPNRTFFYPQRIIFPNVTALVGGTIFQYSLTNEVAAPAPQSAVKESGDDLLPPSEFVVTTDKKTAPNSDESDFRKPDVKQDVPLTRTMTFFSTNMSYSFNHYLKVEHLFNQEIWTKVEDVTYATKFSSLDHMGTSTINYQLSFWNSLIDIVGSFSLLDKFKTTYYPVQGFDQALADKQYSGLDFTKAITFSFAPLLSTQDFKDSKISYDLRWKFLDLYYNVTAASYNNRFFWFDRDTVLSNQVTANLTFQPEEKQHYLKIIYSLPPVLGRIYSELNLFLGIFQTNINVEYKEQTNDVWIFSPLQITENALLGNYFSFSGIFHYDLQGNAPKDLEGIVSLYNYKYKNIDRYLVTEDLQYDFTNSSFSKSLTTINLWDIQTTLLAQRMNPLSALFGTAGPVQQFLFYTAAISYSINIADIYFWKNRIGMLFSINPALNLNFQKHVDSTFNLTFSFKIHIQEFLDLTLDMVVYNNNVYRYIPPFVDAVNADLLYHKIPAQITPINPIVDLLKSINFFNTEDRYESFFKLRSLNFRFDHHLQDWVFSVIFSGVFTYQTVTTGTQQRQEYTWTPTVSFSLKWIPIPQIKREIKSDITGTTF